MCIANLTTWGATNVKDFLWGFIRDSTRFAFLAAAWLLIMPVAHWEMFEWWGFWHGIFYMSHVVVGNKTWYQKLVESCSNNTGHTVSSMQMKWISLSHCKFFWRMPSDFANETIYFRYTHDFGIPSYPLATGHLRINGTPCLCMTHPSKFIMLFSSEDSWHREAVRSPATYRCSWGKLKDHQLTRWWFWRLFFHPHLWKISNMTNIFRWVETTNQLHSHG